MALEKITKVEGRGVYVPGDDIDTDRIIPARFMKCVTFDGLGEYLFYDVRFEADGSSKGHPLDDPKHKDASILFSGKNFGCGSSREHAPQSLHKFGIRAVVAESFAEIFFGNCTTLGIPCVCLPKKDIQEIAALLEKKPDTKITVHVEERLLKAGEKQYPLDVKDSVREALTSGQWDPLGLLRENAAAAAKVYEKLPYAHW